MAFHFPNKRLLTDEEKEAGLEAVALTIGEENVKGTEGGVEAFSGSLEESRGEGQH